MDTFWPMEAQTRRPVPSACMYINILCRWLAPCVVVVCLLESRWQHRAVRVRGRADRLFADVSRRRRRRRRWRCDRRVEGRDAVHEPLQGRLWRLWQVDAAAHESRGLSSVLVNVWRILYYHFFDNILRYQNCVRWSIFDTCIASAVCVS